MDLTLNDPVFSDEICFIILAAFQYDWHERSMVSFDLTSFCGG